MDSLLLGLFDPNDNCLPMGPKCSNDMLDNCPNEGQLPPEPQLGNIEYKLKLLNPSRTRFQHLVTQVINKYNFYFFSFFFYKNLKIQNKTYEKKKFVSVPGDVILHNLALFFSFPV